MQENENDCPEAIEMQHEKIKLKDGRYMIFYEFDDYNSEVKRKTLQTESERGKDAGDV